MYSTTIFSSVFPSTLPATLPYQTIRNPHTVVPAPQLHSEPAHSNHGNAQAGTNEDGDYKVKQSEILQSQHAMYEVLEFIGRGTFGQVVKCLRKDSGELVAVKILKNHPNYARQGQVEIQILAHLSNESADNHNFVKALECFKHQNHTCLVFELLEKNLFDYLKLNKFTPMPLNHIRPILQQVLTALIKLQELGVIHADIKPENIMLVNPALEPFRVKLIDFGSATYTSRAQDNTYLQSRYYRAPEVILGVPFTEKIDIWSLGCVIAELFLGWPLYPGGCEFDQIRFITSTEGLPPKHMLESGKKSRQYFHRPPAVTMPTVYCDSWRLKTEEEYALETGTRPKDTRKYAMKRLQELCSFVRNDAISEQDKLIEELDRLQFVRLLVQMLALDPALRCSPKWCKTHEFVTMNHFNHEEYVRCTRVVQGIRVMQRACRRDKPLNQMLISQQQQQLKYILQQQVLTQAQAAQREQLQQLKQQQDLSTQQHWGLQANNVQSVCNNVQSSSLQYYLNEGLHPAADRRPTQGIYPTPDWSPASEWQSQAGVCAQAGPEYGSKSRPIVISDSPRGNHGNEQLLKDHVYKSQLLRNLSAITSNHGNAGLITAPNKEHVYKPDLNANHFIHPMCDVMSTPVTVPSNAALSLSGLTNALATRYL